MLSACKQKPQEAKGPPGKDRVAKFAATLVVSAPFGDSTAGLAEVKARDRIDLRTEAAGRIREIGFREGAQVRAGQVIVRLEDAEARASRDRAAAKLRLSVATLKRVREQVNAQSASLQQLETSLADSAVCQADLALAEASLAKMEVRAPFAGTVGMREVSMGQWVPNGQLLTALVGSGDVRLEWALPEGLAFRLAPGMALSWRSGECARGGRMWRRWLRNWTKPPHEASVGGLQDRMPGIGPRGHGGGDSSCRTRTRDVHSLAGAVWWPQGNRGVPGPRRKGAVRARGGRQAQFRTGRARVWTA
ncbi:MAG: efflux RND transporter periplasmic adaptor subunit [Fibrobacteres bacterium]|nr:efflux RND transporter periplasmic adaptor subunit [Fibrobacterota bacterium]